MRWEAQHCAGIILVHALVFAPSLSFKEKAETIAKTFCDKATANKTMKLIDAFLILFFLLIYLYTFFCFLKCDTLLCSHRTLLFAVISPYRFCRRYVSNIHQNKNDIFWLSLFYAFVFLHLSYFFFLHLFLLAQIYITHKKTVGTCRCSGSPADEGVAHMAPCRYLCGDSPL